VAISCHNGPLHRLQLTTRHQRPVVDLQQEHLGPGAQQPREHAHQLLFRHLSFSVILLLELFYFLLLQLLLDNIFLQLIFNFILLKFLKLHFLQLLDNIFLHLISSLTISSSSFFLAFSFSSLLNFSSSF
jgi:hypothetical protein